MSRLTVSCVCAWLTPLASAIDIETVLVGNPGNTADANGRGAVAYTYRMGKFEVTAGQYTEFLNAVAATDTYDLYSASMFSSGFGCKIQRSGDPGSYVYSVAADWAQRPVNLVSWGDAARFANWLHNGQPTGGQDLTTTEDGSYFLNGAMTNVQFTAVVRKPGATWVIPTVDEWHKAAYHKNDGATGNYFAYPTSSDAAPTNVHTDPDPGNTATFNSGTQGLGPPFYRTEVGSHELSGSPYGTFDQGGNVNEWTEDLWIPGQTDSRTIRGGSFNDGTSRMLITTAPSGVLPDQNTLLTGFRVAKLILACPADFNNSGDVTVQDIFDFLSAYFGNEMRADFNNSGALSVQDIFDFLSAYFAPCP